VRHERQERHASAEIYRRAAPPRFGADDGGVPDFDATDTSSTVARGLEARREGLNLAWYVAGGRLATATTALSLTAATATPTWARLIQNWWLPPTAGSVVELILVLRDSRGGVGWLRQSVTVPWGTP
jgi:hypothetical protein